MEHHRLMAELQWELKTFNTKQTTRQLQIITKKISYLFLGSSRFPAGVSRMHNFLFALAPMLLFLVLTCLLSFNKILILLFPYSKYSSEFSLFSLRVLSRFLIPWLIKYVDSNVNSKSFKVVDIFWLILLIESLVLLLGTNGMFSIGENSGVLFFFDIFFCRGILGNLKCSLLSVALSSSRCTLNELSS